MSDAWRYDIYVLEMEVIPIPVTGARRPINPGCVLSQAPGSDIPGLAIKQMRLLELPQTLVLQLVRFQHDGTGVCAPDVPAPSAYWVAPHRGRNTVCVDDLNSDDSSAELCAPFVGFALSPRGCGMG
jgi:hypothetical protein